MLDILNIIATQLPFINFCCLFTCQNYFYVNLRWFFFVSFSSKNIFEIFFMNNFFSNTLIARTFYCIFADAQNWESIWYKRFGIWISPYFFSSCNRQFMKHCWKLVNIAGRHANMHVCNAARETMCIEYLIWNILFTETLEM